MTFDEVLRLAVVLVVVGGFAIATIGGLVTPVAGVWRDGDRLIRLGQFAWIVRGHCARDGGAETYRGSALFGRLRLERSASGTAHLEAMGFAPDYHVLLRGAVLARFDLVVGRAELRGDFEGRVFTFGGSPPVVQAVRKIEKAPRVWVKA